jgi:hypothetical protein
MNGSIFRTSLVLAGGAFWIGCGGQGPASIGPTASFGESLPDVVGDDVLLSEIAFDMPVNGFPSGIYDTYPCADFVENPTSELDPDTLYSFEPLIPDVAALSRFTVALVSAETVGAPVSVQPRALPESYTEATGVSDPSFLRMDLTPVTFSVAEAAGQAEAAKLIDSPLTVVDDRGCFKPDATPFTSTDRQVLLILDRLVPGAGPYELLGASFQVFDWMEITADGNVGERISSAGQPPAARFVLGDKVDDVFAVLGGRLDRSAIEDVEVAPPTDTQPPNYFVSTAIVESLDDRCAQASELYRSAEQAVLNGLSGETISNVDAAALRAASDATSLESFALLDEARREGRDSWASVETDTAKMGELLIAYLDSTTETERTEIAVELEDLSSRISTLYSVLQVATCTELFRR